MNDPRTVREIAECNKEQIAALRAELEAVKARLRLLERQAGWDPDALEFPADSVDPHR